MGRKRKTKNLYLSSANIIICCPAVLVLENSISGSIFIVLFTYTKINSRKLHSIKSLRSIFQVNGD